MVRSQLCIITKRKISITDRNFVTKLRLALHNIKVKVVERKVLPFGIQQKGYFIFKNRKAAFCETITGSGVLVSVSNNPLGALYILSCSLVYGEPTLLYRDKKGDYEDITAEFYFPRVKRESIVQRIVAHINLGYEPEELELKDLVKMAKKII